MPSPISFSHIRSCSEPYRIHLAVGDTQQTGHKELTGRDLRVGKVIKANHCCPNQTVLGFYPGESCISALYWGNEKTIEHACTIKPVPNSNDFTDLSPAQCVAVGDPVTCRFSCNYSTMANIKRHGILRVTIPVSCVISRTDLTLVLTHELHFDVGQVDLLPMTPTRLANLN